MIKIDKDILNQMKKDLEKFENNKGRLALKKEVEYLKYRESLTPISKEEFLNRLNQINERFKKFSDTCKKEKIFPMDDWSFGKIISNIKNAKDGLDYAEIIDKLEGILDDEEIALNATIEYIRGYKDEDTIKHIKQLKEEREERKLLLNSSKER